MKKELVQVEGGRLQGGGEGFFQNQQVQRREGKAAFKGCVEKVVFFFTEGFFCPQPGENREHTGVLVLREFGAFYGRLVISLAKSSNIFGIMAFKSWRR